jgi:YHS domain-containing protein
MKRMNWLIPALLLIVAGGVGLGAAQTADKAKDPVCGMSVDKATAKWTYDYKGTTYYFCGESCKTRFAKEPEKFLAAEAKPAAGMTHEGMMHGQMMPAKTDDPAKAKDPVRGMMIDKATAKATYEYKGTKYYFCCEGSKAEFVKEPEKFLAAAAKPAEGMAHGQGMMHGQMMKGEMKAGNEAGCPMMGADVDRKVEIVKDGIVITFTSKNAETVKKIQERAAKMKEAKKDSAGGPSACAEGACASCATKK